MPEGLSHLCRIRRLGAGEVSSLRITYAAPQVAEGTSIYFSGSVWGDGVHRDPYPYNNSRSHTVTVASLESYAPLLIPVYVRDAPGAMGSRWKSELWAFADSNDTMLIFPISWECSILCPPAPPLGHGISPRFMTQIEPGFSAIYGALLYVPRTAADRLHTNLRITDTSENAGSAGTEVPVVGESDLFTTNLHLLGVPQGERFRNTLRIYDVDANAGAAVEVFIINRTNTVLHQQTITFITTGHRHPPTGAPLYPGYIEIPIEQVVTDHGPAGRGELRIQIEPRSPQLRFWAFVATTDNDTQQVTLVTPR